jgi:protein-export membrane protein SecD
MSGTFSANLRVLENSVISPTLGENAIQTGLIAGGISIILIFIFMVLIYKGMGLVADLSLSIYAIILIFLLHAIPGVQLTLPSIAGIILSLGMAVDGNVIIFERIKEEYRQGKRIPASIKSGFKKSLWAILDGNITTIIASIVLYILGSGSIKGFAITLLLGILVSLFTSLVVTRSLLNSCLAMNSTKAKFYGLKKGELTYESKQSNE